MPTHFMLDIETLSTEKNALVLSFAMVPFDPCTGAIGDYFFIVLDGDQQPQRFIDFDTVRWWMSQSEEARRHWLYPDNPPASPKLALESLAAFLQPYKNKGQIRVWANSPTFDCEIMRTLHRDFKVPVPWGFSSERDVRVIKDHIDYEGLHPNGLISHDPVDDCRNQIAWVVEFYKKIGQIR